MTELSNLSCEACSASATLLTTQEIESLLTDIPQWQVVVDSGIKKLKCEFHSKHYKKSMSFTNAIATLAETANHHPQIIVEYSTVTVIWWSHNIKGLHKNDFIMASKTSRLF